MNQSDGDKLLRNLIAKAFVPPNLCATDPDTIEAMLDAAECEPFTDEQVERMLLKAKGSRERARQPPFAEVDQRFRQRKMWHKRALRDYPTMPDEALAGLIAEARQANERYRASQTREERYSWDLRFHELLVGPCGDEAVAEVREAGEVLFRLGRAKPPGAPSHADVVYREHQQILDALRARDYARMTEALWAHFDRAMQDWFEDLLKESIAQERTHLETLAPESTRILISAYIPPVEADEKYREVLARAVAGLIDRRVRLEYVYACQGLLDSITGQPWSRKLFSQAETEDGFERFRSMIVDELVALRKEMPGRDTGRETARQDVKNGLVLHLSGHELLFESVNLTLSYEILKHASKLNEHFRRTPSTDEAVWGRPYVRWDRIDQLYNLFEQERFEAKLDQALAEAKAGTATAARRPS